jgi:hypothetical protein
MTLSLVLLVAEPPATDTSTRNTRRAADTGATTRPPLLPRLWEALQVAVAALRRLRLTSWDMADVRTQEREPLGELVRHLSPPPIGF